MARKMTEEELKTQDYTLPCEHEHGGKVYPKGAKLALRKDQIARIQKAHAQAESDAAQGAAAAPAPRPAAH